MISKLPPDLACIAIFSRASADIRTLQARVRHTQVSPSLSMEEALKRGDPQLKGNPQLEIVRILGPGLLLLDCLLLCNIVLIIAFDIGLLNIVFQLPASLNILGTACHRQSCRSHNEKLSPPALPG